MSTVKSDFLHELKTKGYIHQCTDESALDATKLLYEAAIGWAKAQGFRALNFGGGLGRDNDPLLHFKSGFSKDLHPFYTVRLVCEPALYRRACEAAGAEDGVQGYFPGYRAPPRSNEVVATYAAPLQTRAPPPNEDRR